MHEKDGVKAKIAKFSEDKGFYIILMLCVIAIGISGYVLFFLPNTETVDDYEIGLGESLPSAADTIPDSTPKLPDVTVQLEPEPPVEEDAQASAPAEDLPKVVEKTEPSSVSAEEEELAETWIFTRKPTYTFPVSGEVIREYSVDALLYDETMGDWRTHNGVDFSCTLGDPVMAVADGTVAEIYEDTLEGNIIILKHDDGITSKYCGLAPEAVVAVGDAVKAGETIGTAGNTMKTESLMECHIHLVMKKDGQYIDPLSLRFE